jgi:hypothetical protein
MATSLLIDCRYKLERAREHFESLDKEIAAFLKGNPYELVVEFDSEHSKYDIRIKHRQPFPRARWGLIAGDCAHNARTALDYIAWRLAGSDLADTKTLFPIYRTLSRFDEMVKRRSLESRIDSIALAHIRNLQPGSRPNPESNYLWWLQELDARDKHKLLTPSYMFNEGGTIESVTPTDSEGRPTMGIIGGSWAVDGRADHDAIIATINLPIPSGSPDPHMEVKTDLLFDIAFERGIIGDYRIFPVRDALKKILVAVDEVISDFERLIIVNPHWIPI